MEGWKRKTRDALITGSVASVASTSALLACGALEERRPFAPVNAVSHWYWGERAAHRDHPSVRYTLFGYITHHAAAIFWALIYEKLFGGPRRTRTPAREVANAASIAALACFVDYRMTPRRLTPGYEKRLGRRSLAVVYVMFGLGLVIGGRLIDALANERA